MNTRRKSHILRAGLWVGMLVLMAMPFMTMPSTLFAQDAGRLMKENIARLNEGVAKGDYDYAVSLYAEDGIRITPLTGEIKGRKAVGDFFAAVYKDFSDGKETITWMSAEGNRVAAAITWEAIERKTGKHVNLPMAMLAEFDASGKIKWSQMYFDFAKAMKEAK